MAFNCTLCYLENDQEEYLMLHRVKKKNDVNHDKWVGVGGKFTTGPHLAGSRQGTPAVIDYLVDQMRTLRK